MLQRHIWVGTTPCGYHGAGAGGEGAGGGMPGGAPGALIRSLTCVQCAEGVNSAPACDHSTLICHLHGDAQAAATPVVAAAAEAPQSRRLTDCCEGAEAPVKAACRTSLPVYTTVCQCTTDSV